MKQKIRLADSWPLISGGAEIEFEKVGALAESVVVTFRNQPADIAPKIVPRNEGRVAAELRFKDDYKGRASRLVDRFSDYLNLHFDVAFDLDEVRTDYIPTNDEEKSTIKLHSFASSRPRPTPTLPFSMVAQSLYASESGADPSFVSHLARSARDALYEEHYIDAFRYGFLLIESIYGAGQFKTKQLVDSLVGEGDLQRLAAEAIADFSVAGLHPLSKSAAQLVADYSTPKDLIEHLVDRRGFYFHGNVKHPKRWHPNEQSSAGGLAQVTVQIASGIAHSYSSAMFTDEIGPRYFDNAKAMGAIVKFRTKTVYLDENDLQAAKVVDVSMPGTGIHNDLVLELHRKMLEIAQFDAPRGHVLYMEAIDPASGKLVFRAEYKTDRFAVPDGERNPPQSDPPATS